MSVPVNWKLERAIHAKIRGIQKRIYFWWIENPKGRSRQKLGIQKKKSKKKWKIQRHHCSSGPNRRIHSVLVYKWWLLPVVWLMATSARMLGWWVLSQEMVTSTNGLINGDFCHNVWLMGFIPKNGNFRIWFDRQWLLSVVRLIYFIP